MKKTSPLKSIDCRFSVTPDAATEVDVYVWVGTIFPSL
jgi:hypothetical protein